MNLNTFNNINKWLLGTASLILSHTILKSFPHISKNVQPLIIVSSTIFITTQDLKISITLTLLYHLYNNTKLKTLPLPSLSTENNEENIQTTEKNQDNESDNESPY